MNPGLLFFLLPNVLFSVAPSAGIARPTFWAPWRCRPRRGRPHGPGEGALCARRRDEELHSATPRAACAQRAGRGTRKRARVRGAIAPSFNCYLSIRVLLNYIRPRAAPSRHHDMPQLQQHRATQSNAALPVKALL